MVRGRKFTKDESALIISHVMEYVRANGLEVADVCRNLQKEQQKKGERIWDELTQLLPHRTKKVNQHQTLSFTNASLFYPNFCTQSQFIIMRIENS